MRWGLGSVMIMAGGFLIHFGLSQDNILTMILAWMGFFALVDIGKWIQRGYWG